MPATPFVTQLEDLPQETQRVVNGLHDGLLAIFGNDLAAVWLYDGTLFAPLALDIDLHFLLHRLPNAEEGERIKALHEAVSKDEPFVDEIDSWYVLLEDARRSPPPANVGPWNPGLVDQHWALHRAHWLAGACIVVHGLAPKGVVPAPSWSEVETALMGELDEEARNGGGEAGHACSPYWTLQLCRVLASLETHDVVRSKLDSGAWAIERLPASVLPIVRAAIEAYSTGTAAGLRFPPEEYGAFYWTIRPLIDAAVRA
jgi:hypothetical protein